MGKRGHYFSGIIQRNVLGWTIATGPYVFKSSRSLSKEIIMLASAAAAQAMIIASSGSRRLDRSLVKVVFSGVTTCVTYLIRPITNSILSLEILSRRSVFSSL